MDHALSNAEATPVQQMMLATMAKLMVAKKAHDIETLVSLYHPNCILEQSTLGVRAEGLASLGKIFQLFATHFPDYERDFDGVAFAENGLVSWGNAHVTLTGTFGGMRGNGKRTTVMTFVIYKFLDEKIVYEGHYWDLASLCRQSGIDANLVYQSTPK